MTKIKPNQISDTVSVMTRTTFLEKDVDMLLKCLLSAMQAKNLFNPQETATGSQKARDNK